MSFSPSSYTFQKRPFLATFEQFGGIMSFTHKIFRSISITLLITVLSVFALADTIRLKDGSTIKGTIVSFTNGKFEILIGAGERQRKMTFFADEIESIQFDSKALPVAGTKPASRGYSTVSDGDSTIITVGSSKTPNPLPNKRVILNPTKTPLPTVTNTDTGVKPIQIKVKVLADNTANGWTNAGWVVRKGQRIKITGTGKVSLGNGRYAGPKGITTLPDENKLISDKATGGLIAVIGDDNNDFVFIGDSMEFVATRDGALFLGVNEGVLADNSGAFDVTIEIDPRIGS
jgi:hypothetical protein